MLPWDYMAKTTERQHAALIAHLDAVWNEPDRIDYYLMQIAAVVERGYAKRPERATIDSKRLNFTWKRSAAPRSRSAAVETALWFAALGMNPHAGT